ncbi:DUF3592 domain-containing protein [Streptomyces sp. NRRL WC-3549]|uniref:DUF3592 domain-containing protein n=1 Tax=Streptomyces sp. NRRL WC-3549 TaxID=1463925 RepID=UPI0004CB2D48|nr:DUF3592 domain-containing protein [Streptomyces sp. NRRL WC-3549]
MAKRKKTSRDDWTPPPRSAERRALDRHLRLLRAGGARLPPVVPQRRLILTLSVMALGACAAFLVFWLPSRSLVDDLRSRGVSVAAEVTAAPKNRYGGAGDVKVRFAGPGGEVETVLSDLGGMRPDGLLPGSAVPVTYDPREPTRVLTTRWLDHPPVMTPPVLVTLVFTPLLLGGAVLLTVRRRTLLQRGARTAVA